MLSRVLDVVVQPDVVGFHGWSVVGGLSTLARRGSIRLRSRDLGAPRSSSRVVTVEVEGVRCAFDLTDHRALSASVDAPVVFKRSYLPDDSYRGRTVHPLGLVAGYRTGDEGLLARHTAACVPAHGWRVALTQARVSTGLLTGRGVPPLLSAFERGAAPADGPVLFQVRAWSPEDSARPEDRDAVNGARAAAIAALRETLGPRFVGGFVPSEYARRHYPDLVVQRPTDSQSYAALVRSASIGVSTIGLNSSNPWKLVEYLAAGLAIVSEPLAFQLPEPLVEGTHVHTTPDVETLVSTVSRLCADPEAVRAMSEASRAYYDRCVRPEMVVSRCLDRAVSGSDRDAEVRRRAPGT